MRRGLESRASGGGYKELSEDWTFRRADTQEHMHVIHPYPARMIPQIARELISRYSTPCDVVLDPFCGSGSVLAEAKMFKRVSVGIDINPLACLIAKVKTTPISPDRLEKELRQVQVRWRDISGDTPDFYNLDYWFKKETIRDLSIIKHSLEEIEDKNIRDFFYVCLSKTIRSVSLCRNSEYKLYRIPTHEIRKFKAQALEEFVKNAKAGIKGMRSFIKCSSIPSFIIKGDAKRMPLKPESINLIATSPPYGDSKTTVAYGQFSRYSSLFLGFDEREVRDIDNRSVGSRKIESDAHSKTLNQVLQEIGRRSERRAKAVKYFFLELRECMQEFWRVLRDGSYACVVIGNRTVSRVNVPTDKILVELGIEAGLDHIETHQRRIPTKTIPWSNAPENAPNRKGKTIADERIFILRKNI